MRFIGLLTKKYRKDDKNTTKLPLFVSHFFPPIKKPPRFLVKASVGVSLTRKGDLTGLAA